VPLLRAELAAAGHAAGERTIRRALHRLGWRWKRPKYVLGRPDPAYGEKKPPSRSGRRQ
jgi:transposase